MENLDEMFAKLREKFPDFKVVTATQPIREGSYYPRIELPKPEFDVIIIDHVNLIGYER